MDEDLHTPSTEASETLSVPTGDAGISAATVNSPLEWIFLSGAQPIWMAIAIVALGLFGACLILRSNTRLAKALVDVASINATVNVGSTTGSGSDAVFVEAWRNSAIVKLRFSLESVLRHLHQHSYDLEYEAGLKQYGNIVDEFNNDVSMEDMLYLYTILRNEEETAKLAGSIWYVVMSVNVVNRTYTNFAQTRRKISEGEFVDDDYNVQKDAMLNAFFGFIDSVDDLQVALDEHIKEMGTAKTCPSTRKPAVAGPNEVMGALKPGSWPSLDVPNVSISATKERVKDEAA